jgi:hypothetical protein
MNTRLSKLENKLKKAEDRVAKAEAKLAKRRGKLDVARALYEAALTASAENADVNLATAGTSTHSAAENDDHDDD